MKWQVSHGLCFLIDMSENPVVVMTALGLHSLEASVELPHTVYTVPLYNPVELLLWKSRFQYLKSYQRNPCFPHIPFLRPGLYI